MININIEIAKSKFLLSDKSAYISFPYNENVIKSIKTIPNRRYVPDEKRWEIPVDRIDELKDKFPNANYYIKEKKYEMEIPELYNFKLEPFDYQKEAIKYGLNTNKFILADTQGIGKSMESLHIASIKKELYMHKHCLIICCINALKANWEKEIKLHTNLTSKILGTRYKKNGQKKRTISIKDKIEDIENIDSIDDFFIITNIETFRNDNFSKKVIQLANDGKINTLIMDEVHKIKNPKSLVYNSISKLTKIENIMMLSGTIMVNSPLDLFIPMKMIGIESGDIWWYKKHYCIFESKKIRDRYVDILVGYKNLDELHYKIQNHFLRREKKEILSLPDKIFSTEYLEMTDKQAKLYDEVKNKIDNNLNIDLSDSDLAMMTRLRQITGAPELISDLNDSVKLDRMVEYVEENIKNGHKTIIFSIWSNIIFAAEKRLKGADINTITVTKETQNKVVEVDRFNNSKECPVILGTIASLGTGFSMPEANMIIFLDSPFTDSDRQQAIDRAHRVTTKHNISIVNFVCVDTVDERIEEIVEGKVHLNDIVVNGKLTSGGIKYILS